MALALPLDLMERIVKHLALQVDRIRLSAVNTSWQSAVASAKERYPPPPQLPWLMLLHPVDPVTTHDHRYQFLNLSENKAYTLPLPDIRFQQYFGTGSHGWILAIDKNETSSARLLNPFTGAKISLPSFETFMRCTYKPKLELEVLKVEIDWGSGGIVERVLLLFDYALLPSLAFWRSGDERWSCLDICGWVNRAVVTDILVYKGEFCVVTGGGKVFTCRPGEDPPFVPMVHGLLPPHDYRYRWYMATSLTGELLLVGRVLIEHEFNFRTKRFDIFKLNSNRGSWEKLKSLEGQILFLSNNASICLSARDYPGWKENCIYFIGRITNKLMYRMHNYNDLHIFSLEDERIKPLGRMYHPTMIFPMWLLC